MRSTTRKPTTARKPTTTRSIKIAFPGIVRITINGVAEEYDITEIPTDISERAFQLHKVGADEPYHLTVGQPGEDHCDCMGFTRWRKCKHVDGIKALIANGKL